VPRQNGTQTTVYKRPKQL